ncbi:AtpZ/AtpI family protein [Thermobifida halotolerans]|nr:AtpZ/AtpI family protein [Thermobifida halotolerans]
MSEPRKPDETSQEPAETAVDGVGIVSLLVSGMVVWGGAGWLLDRLTDHQALFLPIGILLGLGLALYMVFARLHARSR